MLYHDDPDWYEKPGSTVEIPLGAKLTRSRNYVVPALPWHKDHASEVIAVIPFGEPGTYEVTIATTPIAQAAIAEATIDHQAIDSESLPLDQ